MQVVQPPAFLTLGLSAGIPDSGVSGLVPLGNGGNGLTFYQRRSGWRPRRRGGKEWGGWAKQDSASGFAFASLGHYALERWILRIYLDADEPIGVCLHAFGLLHLACLALKQFMTLMFVC